MSRLCISSERSFFFLIDSVFVFVLVFLLPKVVSVTTIPERFLNVVGVLKEVHMTLSPDHCRWEFAEDVELMMVLVTPSEGIRPSSKIL